MNNHEKPRWVKRLHNYDSALNQLQNAVELSKERELSDLEKQGLIQAFEFTHELAWKVMKDYFVYQGNSSITGSRDATKEAFSNHLIENGELWMEMIISRNKTSHTYNLNLASDIVNKIVSEYAAVFEAFAKQMKSLQNR